MSIFSPDSTTASKIKPSSGELDTSPPDSTAETSILLSELDTSPPFASAASFSSLKNANALSFSFFCL